MKKVVFTLLMLLVASSVSAAPITVAFCSATTDPAAESASCPDGFGAALQLNDTLPGLDPNDPNDFWLLLGVSSRASDGFDVVGTTGINEVQFDTPFKTGDFESVPTITSFADGTGFATAFFGALQQCPSGNTQDKSVCSQGFTDTGDVDIFQFYVNLDDSITSAYAASTLHNMRVSFFPIGNLSPESGFLPPGTPTPFEEPPGSPVPEPTSMVLLGTGLTGLAMKLRRRK